MSKAVHADRKLSFDEIENYLAMHIS